MSKTFFPEVVEFVPASSPHPPHTQYKVCIGMEEWNATFVPVIKVQMVYEGVVAGRRSPSYPLNSDDHSRVNDAILRLLAQHFGSNE